MKTAAVLKQVADRKKAVNDNNASTALDNTTDDIQEARDDTGGDDVRTLQEMIVLNGRGLVKKTRGASSLCLRTMNPSNQHAKSSGRTLRLEFRWVTNLSEERKRFYLIDTLLDPRTKMIVL